MNETREIVDALPVIEKHPHVLHYLRDENRRPYGAVVALELPTGEIRAGWSLISEEDTSKGINWNRRDARNFAVSRALDEVNARESLRMVSNKAYRKIAMRNLGKVKAQLYVRQNEI